jgi:valyl-tRNA synthetase
MALLNHGLAGKNPASEKILPHLMLVTGFDILFFWVARMMMMGIQFMDEVPFTDVLRPCIGARRQRAKRCPNQRAMSLTPLVMDKYGTDAFRFTLAAFAAQGRDIKMSERRVEGYRHFINKLWNAARFSLMHLDAGYDRIDEDHLTLPDQWILARLSQVTRQVSAALDDYRFNDAAGAAYQFVWHEFCDWYLEAVKPALYDEEKGSQQAAAKQVLWTVLRDTLVLLHPFAPFVTEEIWDKLPGTSGSVMQASYPVPDAYVTHQDRLVQAEQGMMVVMDVITGIRNIRGEMNIAPSSKLDVAVASPIEAVRQTIANNQDLIVNLARLNGLSVQESDRHSASAATAIVTDATIMVELEGVVDFAQEIQRLEKEIGKLVKELTGIEKKLSNPGFLSKAPEPVVAEVREKEGLLSEKKKKLTATLEKIKALAAAK